MLWDSLWFIKQKYHHLRDSKVWTQNRFSINFYREKVLLTIWLSKTVLFSYLERWRSFSNRNRNISNKQYLRIAGRLRLEGTLVYHSKTTSLLHLLEHTKQACIQTAFKYVQSRKLNSLSGQPVLELSHPHNKEHFPHVQSELPAFQFLPISSHPIHWGQSGPILLSSSFQILMYMDQISPSLLRAEQAEFLQPFLLSEMLQSHKYLSSPSFLVQELQWPIAEFIVNLMTLIWQHNIF